MERLNKNNYASVAQLKELMTTPPMTAQKHAEILRERIRARRKIEDERERKQALSNSYDFA